MHGTSKKDFSNFSSVLHNILPFNFTKIFKQKSEYFKTLVYRILFSRNKYVLWKNFLNFLFDHLLFKTNLNQKGFLKEYFQSPYKIILKIHYVSFENLSISMLFIVNKVSDWELKNFWRKLKKNQIFYQINAKCDSKHKRLMFLEKFQF